MLSKFIKFSAKAMSVPDPPEMAAGSQDHSHLPLPIPAMLSLLTTHCCFSQTCLRPQNPLGWKRSSKSSTFDRSTSSAIPPVKSPFILQDLCALSSILWMGSIWVLKPLETIPRDWADLGFWAVWRIPGVPCPREPFGGIAARWELLCSALPGAWQGATVRSSSSLNC